jgi:PadR family transcriptional regulator, regulatory protein PadR
MSRSRRPSVQTLKVLEALAGDPAAWRYGYEIGAQVGVRSGSLYPILVRLADRELLDATWETEMTPGRPPRHLYRLSARGLEYTHKHATSPDAAARTPRRSDLLGAS